METSEAESTNELQHETEIDESKPLNYVWLHRRDQVKFTRPDLWLVLGIRGSGKSSFLERVAEQYSIHGASIIDLFGSADSEGLAWLRSPYKGKRFLLLKGEDVIIRSEHEVKPAEELTQRDLEEYDFIINASALYCSREEEYAATERISNLLYNRSRHKHRRLLCALVRESASFFYAKLKMTGSQQEAKANTMYMLREARHNQIALVSDALYFQAVEKELRMSVDYTIIKAMGMMRLPEHISWLYNPAYVKVHYTVFQDLKPQEFFIVTKKGALGYGLFDRVEWHKDEMEYLPDQVGLDVEYLRAGAVPKGGRGLDDEAHANIMKLYAQGLGMNKISTQTGISNTTVNKHIDLHNSDVERHGTCPACKRVDSPFASKHVYRGCQVENSASEGRINT